MSEALAETMTSFQCGICRRVQFVAPWSYLLVVQLCVRCEHEGEAS